MSKLTGILTNIRKEQSLLNSPPIIHISTKYRSFISIRRGTYDMYHGLLMYECDNYLLYI